MNPTTLIHERVQAARDGANPTVIARLGSGWAVLGDRQFLPGYSLLLPDPVVPRLNDLTQEARAAFLLDMAALGDAVLEVTGALRMNYSILGNTEPALHAHVFARYAHEPDEYRPRPVWVYPKEVRDSVPFDAARDQSLVGRIREVLTREKLV